MKKLKTFEQYITESFGKYGEPLDIDQYELVVTDKGQRGGTQIDNIYVLVNNEEYIFTNGQRDGYYMLEFDENINYSTEDETPFIKYVKSKKDDRGFIEDSELKDFLTITGKDEFDQVEGDVRTIDGFDITLKDYRYTGGEGYGYVSCEINGEELIYDITHSSNGDVDITVDDEETADRYNANPETNYEVYEFIKQHWFTNGGE